MKEEKRRGGGGRGVERQEKVDNQPPAIQEENEMEMGSEEKGAETGGPNQDCNQHAANIIITRTLS